MSRAKESVNAGIQATNVTADVMAVGSGARASKVVNAGEANRELVAMVADLRKQIDAMALQPQARQALEEDVAKLDAAAAKKDTKPEQVGGLLNNIVGKLKMVGVMMGDTLAIAEPIKKIVEMFGIPLPW
jgi:hypothetical protein